MRFGASRIHILSKDLNMTDVDEHKQTFDYWYTIRECFGRFSWRPVPTLMQQAARAAKLALTTVEG